MARSLSLEPVTRVSGPLSVQASLSQGCIQQVKVSGTMLRGFEWIMKDRELRDAVYMTQRICGICSLAHGAAASYVLDDLFDLEIPHEAQLIRNIMFGADLLQNHLRHYYVFCLPDYVKMPDYAPFLGQDCSDLRLPFSYNQLLQKHYFEGIKISQLCHQILALFGGKAPHQHSFIFGGVSIAPQADMINSAISMIKNIKKFIKETLLMDQVIIERYYSDYFNQGITPGRFLSFGMFRFGTKSEKLVWPSGVLNKRLEMPDPKKITEDISHAWYDEENPSPYKPTGYTYVKAVHYDGGFYEVGSLARMTLLGFYQGGTGVLDRLRARICECEQVADLMEKWLLLLQPLEEAPIVHPKEIVKSESLIVTDVMRGPLLHHAILREDQIRQYNLITPTQWNFSPQDRQGRPGPVAQAIGGSITKSEREAYILMGRIIRSFDPCMACATHLWQQ